MPYKVTYRVLGVKAQGLFDTLEDALGFAIYVIEHTEAWPEKLTGSDGEVLIKSTTAGSGSLWGDMYLREFGRPHVLLADC